MANAKVLCLGADIEVCIKEITKTDLQIEKLISRRRFLYQRLLKLNMRLSKWK